MLDINPNFVCHIFEYAIATVIRAAFAVSVKGEKICFLKALIVFNNHISAS